MEYKHLGVVPESMQKVTRQMDYLDSQPFQGRERHVFIAELAKRKMRYLGTVGSYVGGRYDQPDDWLVKYFGLNVARITVPFRSSQYDMYVGLQSDDATVSQRANLKDELKRLASEKLPRIPKDTLPVTLRRRYVGRQARGAVRAKLSR